MKTLKLLIIFPIITLFISSCKQTDLGNNPKTYLKEQNLKGKVHRIIENSYYAEYKFGEVQKGEKSDGQVEGLFNEQGKLVETKFINIFGNKVVKKYNDKELELETVFIKENGELDSKTIFRYDEKGNRIEENYYDSNSKLDRKNVAEYDEKGNITRLDSYELSKLLNIAKYTYVYDIDGNILEINGSLYDLAGNLVDKLKDVNKYDSNGNLLQELRSNLKGNLEYKYATYKYDKNNNEIEVCNYNSSDKLIYIRSKKFDNRNNVLEEKKVHHLESPEDFNGSINSCDTELVPVNIVYNSEITKNSYEYDIYDNVVKTTNYRSYVMNGVIVFENECSKFFDYQYDDNKNWIIRNERIIKENSFHNENIIKITERKIEYYK